MSLNPLVYNGKFPDLWAIADEVMDPEIPVLSIVDLGILRNVERNENEIELSITPTYSGCPAMDTIATDLKNIFEQKGFEVKIKTVLSPAWTTDWISDEAKERLRKSGIAPPENSSADKNSLLGKTKTIKCPRCGSYHTEMISQFGSTACKSLWKCLDCKEPFDYFKCI
ncbi:MAG: phenylacetate-CoA oxygenase subunit PaaJ [Bacteroidetes bacterium]|nr:phenylacetate-CoA oxygenase subunit PaaJ [Bacteroidota bacterium]